MLLKEIWNQLQIDRKDKIRISVGTSDNSHVHHAVKLLEVDRKKLQSKREFKYNPGDHFTVFTEDYKKGG